MKLARKLSVLLALAAFVLVAEVKTTDPMDARVREVALLVKCQCGCGSTVAECNMIHCHFGEPVRKEIRAGLEAGLSPDQIVEKLVAEYGDLVRTTPPAGTFGSFSWAMPFIVVFLGLATIPFVLMRWRRNQAAVEAGGSPSRAHELDPEAVRRFEAQIEKDLATEE